MRERERKGESDRERERKGRSFDNCNITRSSVVKRKLVRRVQYPVICRERGVIGCFRYLWVSVDFFSLHKVAISQFR